MKWGGNKHQNLLIHWFMQEYFQQENGENGHDWSECST